MAAGDIIRVVQSGIWLEKVRVDNAFHLQDLTGEFTPAELCDYWEFEVLPTWLDWVSQRYGVRSITAQVIGPAGGDYASRPIASQGTLSVDNKLPVVCAGVITWRTTRGGRRGRGRTFICGLPNNTPDDLYLDVEGQLALAAIKNNFMTLFGPEGLSTWRLGVFSRAIGGSMPPVNPAGFAPVTSGWVQAYICTMGSRRAQRGG